MGAARETAGAVRVDQVRAERASPRPWVVPAVVAAVALVCAAAALVAYLATGHPAAPVARQQGSTGPVTSRWLAHTDPYGRYTASLDLGPGGQAVTASGVSGGPAEPDASFISGDGVRVTVRTLTLYNDGWDDKDELQGLVQDYRDEYLVECSAPARPGGGGGRLPTALAAGDDYLRFSATCEPRTGQDPGFHEVYAFAAEPHRVNDENVARDWVLVAASGEQADAVRAVLGRAVATLGLGPDRPKGQVGTGPAPADPGPARDRYPTSIWDDVAGFFLPDGWSLVGAGGFDVAAPEGSGVEMVRSYRSPGIVLARESPRPGGSQSVSALSDRLVATYSQDPTDNGCAERTDFEPTADTTAEIRWTGCPNGLVDRVAVYPDGSGGVILVSVRASDDQVADDLLHDLAG